MVHPSIPERLKQLRTDQNPARYGQEDRPVLYLPIPELTPKPPDKADEPEVPKVIHIDLTNVPR